MRAFLLFLLKLALYARRDSNPQPLAPEANALTSLAASSDNPEWADLFCHLMIVNVRVTSHYLKGFVEGEFQSVTLRKSIGDKI